MCHARDDTSINGSQASDGPAAAVSAGGVYDVHCMFGGLRVRVSDDGRFMVRVQNT